MAIRAVGCQSCISAELILLGRKVGVIPVILGLGYDTYVILILCHDRYDRYFLPLLRHWAVAAGEH